MITKKRIIKHFSMFLCFIELPFAALAIAAITFIIRSFYFGLMISQWTHLSNFTKPEENKTETWFEREMTELNSNLILMTDVNILFFAMLSSVALGVAVWNQKSYFMLPYLYHEPILLLSHLIKVVDAVIHQDFLNFGVFLGFLCKLQFLTSIYLNLSQIYFSILY